MRKALFPIKFYEKEKFVLNKWDLYTLAIILFIFTVIWFFILGKIEHNFENRLVSRSTEQVEKTIKEIVKIPAKEIVKIPAELINGEYYQLGTIEALKALEAS